MITCLVYKVKAVFQAAFCELHAPVFPNNRTILNRFFSVHGVFFKSLTIQIPTTKVVRAMPLTISNATIL